MKKNLSNSSHLFILVAFFVVSSLIYNSLAWAAGEIITRVNVKGNHRIEKGAILAEIKSRKGGYFSKEAVSEDIKRVFKMGYFEDVKVDLKTTDLGPALTFIVQERPFVKQIKYEGNQEVVEESIRDVVTVRPYTIFSLEKVKETKAKIEELYEKKGFFLADISHRLETKNEETTLIFHVREGKKVRIKRINLLGNKQMEDKTLFKLMETKEGGAFSWLTESGKFEEETLQKDIDLITAFYYNNGFVQIKIEEPKVFMSPDKKWLYLTIRMSEGEQYSIGKIGFSGDLADDAAPDEDMRKDLKSVEGEVFNRDNLRQDIVALTDRFGDKGYAFANVTPRTELDAEKKLMHITFDAEKGELVYIGRINISGNTKTRDKVVRREMKLHEGDLYNGSALRRSRQKIFNLGFFKEANVSTQRGSEKDKLDIDITVEEGPTGTLSVGMGYSSNDGLVGMMQVSQGNLFGRGQKLSFNTEVGGETSSYSISFTEPYLFDSSVSAGFDLFNKNKDYSGYSESKTGWALRTGVPVGEYSRLNLRYRFEEVEISQVTDPNSEIKLYEGTTRTSSITTSISRDSRDHYMNPTKGSVNSLSLEYAGDLLGQDNNFYKVISKSAWYFPLPWEHVVMLNGRIGYATGIEDDDLNIGERFFLGGINTLRGYSYRSVGPEVNGVVIGGYKELLFNAEYLVTLSEAANLKGLLFFDAGNAFDRDENYAFSDLRKSYGYGVRWFSPVGPLRLEWGKALDPKVGQKKSRWEFSIGTFF